jgi:hypothetical protein
METSTSATKGARYVRVGAGLADSAEQHRRVAIGFVKVITNRSSYSAEPDVENRQASRLLETVN